MKIFKFVLLLIIVSCSKEDKLEYDKSISYKNGVTMAPIFFEKNGTTTNVKVSNGTDLFYESFNYEFIDSIVFKQVSSSYAKVGYSNSESMAMQQHK